MYVTNITSIPDSIVLFQGESLNLGLIFGMTLKEKNNSQYTVETSSVINENNRVQKKIITAKLFNLIDLKEIEVDIIPKTSVIPLGNLVGLKLYT